MKGKTGEWEKGWELEEAMLDEAKEDGNMEWKLGGGRLEKNRRMSQRRRGKEKHRRG